VYGTLQGGACASLPGAPTGIVASALASDSVTLSWTAPAPGTGCAITGYRVYQNGTQAAAPAGTSASLGGLAASTTYAFTVAAVNAYGVSARSAPLSVTTPASTTGEPPGFWDASNLPVAKNVMMFKFLNRTNGKYPDAQLYWAFTQNGVTQVRSFAQAPTFDMPANSSGRMYFYVVTDPSDPVTAADPTRSPYYDFVEFTIGGTPPAFNGNTTRVDAWALKIAMRLRSPAGDDTVGEDYATFAESREATFARFIAETPAEFAHLAQPPFAPYRIVEPTTGQFKVGGTYQHYMDSWVDQLWASNGLTVAKPTYFCNPIAQPDLSAACFRHVGLGAFNPDGTLKSGSTLWSTSAQFYAAAPAHYYARFWHAHALGGKAYGFPYDDVGGYSSYVSRPNPQYMLIAVGW
jgi:chitodextrinase